MNIENIILEAEKNLSEQFREIDERTIRNSKKVLEAFHRNKIGEAHFSSTTGYGYNDIGRDKIEEIFRDVLGAESALVRNQFISGSHALTVAFFAFLRPDDEFLCITGEPYDTLKEVIGIKENESSLKSYNINYDQVDLIEDDFDVEEILSRIKNKNYKLIHIQRSRGYSKRASITIDKLERVVKEIRRVDEDVIIMVDNCYCELVEDKSPLEVGADIIVGSLIKNLGGGIAPNGAYIAGKKYLVDLAGERLTLPGEGREVGPSLGVNSEFLRGIYMAPSVVGSSLKISVLVSYVLDKMGYEVSPKFDEKRADIVSMITFHNRDTLIKFVQGIQKGSAIDSNALPMPTEMPGYEDDIIMASGSFIQGSSIEISCDGPLREPYIAYLQGGLTYEYGKLALISALREIIDDSER